MKTKKSGGLSFNPLLQKTEPEESKTSEHVDPQTHLQADKQERRPVDAQERRPADTPTSEHVDPQTRLQADKQERRPVDMSTSRHADPQTRTQVHTSTSASKFTFYFTEEQLDRLDKIWSELRQKRRETGQQRVSKSQIVRVALDRLLDDFESDPDKIISLLVANLEE